MSKTRFKDGPWHGLEVDKPPANMRKKTHAIAWRLPDEQQPDKPVEEGGNGFVRFVVYMWLSSEQCYGWVEGPHHGFLDVNSDQMLRNALDVIEGKGPMVGFGEL
jgi:hypothetical protein